VKRQINIQQVKEHDKYPPNQTKERREGGDRGDQEEKRGSQKGREQSSQESFP